MAVETTRIPSTDAFDVSKLSTELADYFIDNREAISQNLMFNEEFDRCFTIYNNVRDKLTLGFADINLEVLPQSDYTAFAPQNDVIQLSNRFLQTEEIKIDMKFIPMELKRSYERLVLGPNSKLDPLDMTFARYFFTMINNKIKEQLILKAVFQGVRNDAGTTSIDAMDGVLKMIADEITATNLTPVATGAVSYATILDDIKAVVKESDAIPAWGSIQKQVLVSDTLFNWYAEKLQETRPYLLKSTDRNLGHVMELPLDNHNAVVKRQYGLGTSQRIICTTKENMCLGFDMDGSAVNVNNFIIQPFERTIKVMGDFKAGFNFKALVDGALSCNDQA